MGGVVLWAIRGADTVAVKMGWSVRYLESYGIANFTRAFKYARFG